MLRAACRPRLNAPASLLLSPGATLQPRHAQSRSFTGGQLLTGVQTGFEAGLQTAQHVIVSFHGASGLSWAITIPLVALGVNLLFRLPFTAHSDLLAHRRSKAVPVLQAWQARLLREAVREKVPSDKIKDVVTKRTERETRRLYAALGLQSWKLWTVLMGVPGWMMSLGAIRRLCTGAGAADPAGAVATGSAALGPADHAASVSALADAASHTAQSTFAAEGMLWFTDLTAADPYYILPFCFAALTAVNAWPQNKSTRETLFPRLNRLLTRSPAGESQPETSPEPKSVAVSAVGGWRGNMTKFLVFGSPMLGILTASFPAAMHLYTITSASSTLVAKHILSRFFVTNGGVEVCKHREIPVIRPKIPRKPMPEGSGVKPLAS
ncbi:uncharacterized protein JN550_012925 [Neoarthrinium moseri]|uniref:uncharacterized protein n=1 Tax=Neoarthrinium moseri TaxID=1658444 RepID=UPI001FDE75EC|nr:uncharacterized protein JN550_012925 [Neoarthrinium moseri]KAI1858032.1 hypothetical protein JN550_012925 [Neoarthrinium moseri]